MIQSTFDLDGEGWTVAGGGFAYDPDLGAIRGWDSDSSYWQFVASDEWLGDRSGYYGATLSFDLKQTILTSQLDNSTADVTIRGAGMTLVIDAGGNPDIDWTSYSVNLSLGAGWKVGGLTGRVATEAEIKAVLADLTSLSIRGEFVSGLTDDVAWLDNVELSDPGAVTVIPGGQQILETFDSGIAGWSFIADVADFSWKPTGGNDGGYLESVDYSTGAVWYYVASDRFLGDRGAFFGGELSFDLKQSTLSSQFDDVDIAMTGAGLTLVFDTPDNPGLDWTSYSVTLSDAAAWHVGALNGALATNAQIRAVLGDLQSLHIRGEFVVGGDTGGLDNVALTALADRVYLLSDPIAQDLLGGYARIGEALSVATDGQAILVAEDTGIGASPWTVRADDITVISDEPLTGTFRLANTALTFTLMGDNRAKVTAGSAFNLVTGSDGANKIESGGGNDTIIGGLGGDTLYGGGDHDLIIGDEGNDTLRGDNGSDTVMGGVGDDLVRGGGGRDWLDGGEGNDELRGESSLDTLVGGEGDDTLIGGAGHDSLIGGNGSDVFVFGVGEGRDRIADFDLTVDTVRLDASLWGDSTTDIATIIADYARFTQGNVVMEFDDGEVLTFEGLSHPLMLNGVIELF